MVVWMVMKRLDGKNKLHWIWSTPLPWKRCSRGFLLVTRRENLIIAFDGGISLLNEASFFPINGRLGNRWKVPPWSTIISFLHAVKGFLNLHTDKLTLALSLSLAQQAAFCRSDQLSAPPVPGATPPYASGRFLMRCVTTASLFQRRTKRTVASVKKLTKWRAVF